MKSKLEFESLRHRFDEDGFVIVRGLYADDEFCELQQQLQDFDPKTVDAVPIELAPGEAVAHSSATIHSTDKNRTSRHRRALATFCYGASTVRDEEAFARYKESLKAQLDKRDIAVTT